MVIGIFNLINDEAGAVLVFSKQVRASCRTRWPAHVHELQAPLYHGSWSVTNVV
jgi:hypothetical protein